MDKVQRRQEVLGLEGEEVRASVCVHMPSTVLMLALMLQDPAEMSDAFLLHQTASAVYRQAIVAIPGEQGGALQGGALQDGALQGRAEWMNGLICWWLR